SHVRYNFDLAFYFLAAQYADNDRIHTVRLAPQFQLRVRGSGCPRGTCGWRRVRDRQVLTGRFEIYPVLA
ncbi:hypothetical protein Q5N85_19815, partial [Acinetobacter baumannii]|nr:hypothetical protein [Acinetobacter baumannii]